MTALAVDVVSEQGKTAAVTERAEELRTAESVQDAAETSCGSDDSEDVCTSAVSRRGSET